MGKVQAQVQRTDRRRTVPDRQRNLSDILLSGLQGLGTTFLTPVLGPDGLKEKPNSGVIALPPALGAGGVIGPSAADVAAAQSLGSFLGNNNNLENANRKLEDMKKKLSETRSAA